MMITGTLVGRTIIINYTKRLIAGKVVMAIDLTTYRRFVPISSNRS